MGYIKHHAIVVTSWSSELIEKAHAKAKEIFDDNLSGITPEVVNGTRSFLVPPDGSKEHWDESDAGNARREQFKAWLHSQAYSDLSSALSWVEVAYPGDDAEAVVVEDGKKLYREKRATKS